MGRDLSKSVVSDQRRMRMMSVKVTYSAGVPSLSGSSKNSMSITDTGTGDFLLTLDEAYRRVPEVLVTSAQDSRVVRVGTVTVSTVQILIDDLAGAAADGDVYVMILGSEDPDFI